MTSPRRDAIDRAGEREAAASAALGRRFWGAFLDGFAPPGGSDAIRRRVAAMLLEQDAVLNDIREFVNRP